MKIKTLLTVGLMTFTGILATAQTATEQKGQFFGESFALSDIASFTDMLSLVQEKDSAILTVEALVTEVCQKKGCWMNLTDSYEDQDPMMVRFKDYGFFVPKDLAGRQVVVRGKVYREMTPVDELRHYAEDAGKSEDEIAAITQPREEIKFLATGVWVRD